MGFDRKRRNKRYDVQNVSGSLIFTIDVNVINMSLDGMAVESSKRLNVGRVYSLKIVHNDKKIRLTGNVVWCVLTRSDSSGDGAVVPVYKAGLEFEDVISDRAKELVDFMEGNVVIKLEKRLFGRFKLKPKEPVNLDSEVDFLVKTISLSGMLIETEILPELDSIFDMEVKFNSSTIFIRGRVAHIKQVSEENHQQLSRLGIEFVDVSREAKKSLEEFILQELEST
jgi:Tfp pilus assembly protein PilZ